MSVRLVALGGCCLFGAITGWAAALAAGEPQLLHGEQPGSTLVVYGALSLFAAGYLLGSRLRRRTPTTVALRAALATVGVAFAAKAMVPALAPWTVGPIAAAVCGVVVGLASTR